MDLIKYSAEKFSNDISRAGGVPIEILSIMEDYGMLNEHGKKIYNIILELEGKNTQ